MRRLNPFRRDTLRAQLLWWLTLPLLVTLMFDAVISYRAALSFANGAYDEGLFDTARALAQQVKTGNGKVEVNLPTQAREILESDPYDKVFYTVIAPDGTSVAGNHDLRPPRVPVDARTPVSYYDAVLNQTPIRVAAYSVFDSQGTKLFTVLSAETLVKRQTMVKNILITVILPQVVIITFAAVLLVYGVRRGLVPLLRLTAAIARRGHHDLSVIDEVRSPEEVRPLIHAINELMRRLSGMLSAQERFIADAAHQLRTPLAGLLAQAERALKEQHIEGMRPALEHIRTSSKQVTRLVNQLLTFARAEPNANSLGAVAQVDLAELVRQTTMEWVPGAVAQGTDLGYVGPEADVLIEGDRLLLRELLNNLIDNALRYGGRNCTVTVGLETTPSVAVQVEDDGPGVPQPYRERIFERFYRLPGTGSGGCGLGLAIVRRIASAHKATVSLGQPKKGASFRVDFGKSLSQQDVRIGQ